jgi:hypothetical protein
MNKRMFLKLSGAILGGSSGGKILGAAAGASAPVGKLTNWAGNQTYSTKVAAGHRERARTFQ